MNKIKKKNSLLQNTYYKYNIEVFAVFCYKDILIDLHKILFVYGKENKMSLRKASTQKHLKR